MSLQQETRVRTLQERYQVAFEHQFPRSLALGNYFYLDVLDSVSRLFQWNPQPAPTLVDVGSQHFYYAPVLEAFFRPKELTGVELEGYRICQDGFSRHDYAMAYIRDIPNARYEVMDFCEYPGTIDGLTCWFPFVEPEALVRWRLPLSVYRPEALVSAMVRVLRQDGFVFMVNQGVSEWARARRLMEDTPFHCIAQWVGADLLLDKPVPPVVSIWHNP